MFGGMVLAIIKPSGTVTWPIMCRQYPSFETGEVRFLAVFAIEMPASPALYYSLDLVMLFRDTLDMVAHNKNSYHI